MNAREFALRIEQSQFSAGFTSQELAFIVRVLRGYADATAVQGDEEVMRYVTSGNAIPVTRCTVSADLIRQLVADRQPPEVEPPMHGTWPAADPRRAFVEGAKWQLWDTEGATMFASERERAEAEAEKRYPFPEERKHESEGSPQPQRGEP